MKGLITLVKRLWNPPYRIVRDGVIVVDKAQLMASTEFRRQIAALKDLPTTPLR